MLKIFQDFSKTILLSIKYPIVLIFMTDLSLSKAQTYNLSKSQMHLPIGLRSERLYEQKWFSYMYSLHLHVNSFEWSLFLAFSHIRTIWIWDNFFLFLSGVGRVGKVACFSAPPRIALKVKKRKMVQFPSKGKNPIPFYW